MNRKLPIALALSLAFGLAANGAMASNTITINGKLTATTCNVVGGQGLNGTGGSADFTVTLPTLATGDFAAPGATGGAVPFTLSLSGASCTDGTEVSAHFAPATVDVDQAHGTLKNKASPGSNIQVQFLDGQDGDAAIDLAKYGKLKSVTVANSAASLTYVAQYYAAAAATAGDYSSTMQYDIDYN
jgi:major type 1 subunit fimbrin (pilin)